MFNSKIDVVAAVKTFADLHGIPQDKICLGGGGALMLMDGRKETADLNVWVDNPHFSRLCEEFKVTNHPMTDTVVSITVKVPDGYVLEGRTFQVWVRERNRYFNQVDDYEVAIFDALTLSIHKHGGMIEVKRPADKRAQDRKDIRFLNDILAERNKVREVA
ncbi:hypothetical protein D3C81_828180 [compost metagenome]